MFHSSVRSLLCLCSLMIAGARQVWLLHAKILSRVPMVFSGRGVPGKIPLVYLAVFAAVWQWGGLPGDKVSGTAFADPVVHVLSGPGEHLTIPNDGDVHLVYGTTGNNQVTVAHAAVAHLRHFPGENTIHIQTDMAQCFVVRSGAMVTIRNPNDGTRLKIPATSEKQTLNFNGGSKTLQIIGGKVDLDGLQVNLTEQSLYQDTQAPVVDNTLPANGTADVAVDTSITIHFSEPMDQSTLILDNFSLNSKFGFFVNPLGVECTLQRSDTQVILTPVEPLAYKTSYVLKVRTGVQDRAGNYLANEKSVYFTTKEKLPGTEKIIDLGNGVDLTLVWIPPGSFEMGSLDTDPDANDNEKPRHEVTLTQGFWMGKYEVTQAQWEQIMGSNPSHFQMDNRPVEKVSWNDVQDFIAELNQVTEKTFSLPTEAQWEYAARGGNAYNKYSGSDDLDQVAWYSDNSNSTTHPVGQKAANDWGLHDMSGNVWEWCQDWYGEYSSGPITDPTGPASGEKRVIRGSSWYGSAQYLRLANRHRFLEVDRFMTLGFRLVMQP